MDKVMETQIEMLLHTGFNVAPVNEPPEESRGRNKGSPRARNWDIAIWFVKQHPNQWFEFTEDRIHNQFSQFRKQFDGDCFEMTQRYQRMYVRYMPKKED